MKNTIVNILTQGMLLLCWYVAGAQMPSIVNSDLAGTLVLIEGGVFLMGSETGENDERPIHSVVVGDFYLNKYEVTLGQFQNFVNETGYLTDAERGDGSIVLNGGKGEKKSGVNWRFDATGNPVLPKDFNHPVMHVSWNDAKAYCNWLSTKTGDHYRLPTEAEWEYAAGNGALHTLYSWGDVVIPDTIEGNVADISALQTYAGWTIFEGYTDGFTYTAPVGSFQPNSYGLYDMTGNVWEWCEDVYDPSGYKNRDAEMLPPQNQDSPKNMRGCSWGGGPKGCRVANRGHFSPNHRNLDLGFRVAKDVVK